MKQAVKELGVDLEWGGDWTKKDYPHFELQCKFHNTQRNRIIMKKKIITIAFLAVAITASLFPSVMFFIV